MSALQHDEIKSWSHINVHCIKCTGCLEAKHIKVDKLEVKELLSPNNNTSPLLEQGDARIYIDKNSNINLFTKGQSDIILESDMSNVKILGKEILLDNLKFMKDSHQSTISCYERVDFVTRLSNDLSAYVTPSVTFCLHRFGNGTSGDIATLNLPRIEINLDNPITMLIAGHPLPSKFLPTNDVYVHGVISVGSGFLMTLFEIGKDGTITFDPPKGESFATNIIIPAQTLRYSLM